MRHIAAWLVCLMGTLGAFGTLAAQNAERERVFPSIAEAKAYYEPLAQAGDVVAQVQMGRLCEDGGFTEYDHDAAVYWYNQAALQNNAYAQERYEALSNDLLFTKATKFWLSTMGIEPCEENCAVTWFLAIVFGAPFFPILIPLLIIGCICA